MVRERGIEREREREPSEIGVEAPPLLFVFVFGIYFVGWFFFAMPNIYHIASLARANLIIPRHDH
jgi:hypothetical protein